MASLLPVFAQEGITVDRLRSLRWQSLLSIYAKLSQMKCSMDVTALKTETPVFETRELVTPPFAAIANAFAAECVVTDSSTVTYKLVSLETKTKMPFPDLVDISIPYRLALGRITNWLKPKPKPVVMTRAMVSPWPRPPTAQGILVLG